MGVPPFLILVELKDYYKILELDRSASIGEIRKAYRRLAKEKHPDANPARDSSQFVELNEAYSVIGSPLSKTKYDKLYDHYILKKPVSNRKKFTRNEDRRTGSVRRKSSEGKAKGQKRASQSKGAFERKTNRWAFFDTVLVIFQGVFEFLAAFS